MGWLFSRLLAALLCVLLAGLGGWLAGTAVNLPVLGAVLGALLGALGYALFDALRGQRFLTWLQSRDGTAAPRDAGFWGEVGYRVERSTHLLEQQIDREKVRLDQFLSAIEASPNGVMLLDVNDQIEWCNSVAADHFGIDPQRDRQQPITNLVRAPIFVSHLQAGLFDEAVSFPGPGARGTVSVLIRPYGDSMKLVLSQDITERERNDSMRRGFVANVSHEIRTPLTVLSGFIETMSSLQLTEVERRRDIELMAQQAQRMQHLVGDLLTLAQLEGSPRPAADRWVPVQPLLTQVRAAAEALSSGRHTLVCAGVALPEGVVDLIAGGRAGTAQRYCQPGQQRHSLHAQRRRGSCVMGNSFRWGGRTRGARHWHRHCQRTLATPDRTFLPRGWQPITRHRRHWPGTVDRQACRATSRWRA